MSSGMSFPDGAATNALRRLSELMPADRALVILPQVYCKLPSR
jgi:hypothetical protein